MTFRNIICLLRYKSLTITVMKLAHFGDNTKLILNISLFFFPSPSHPFSFLEPSGSQSKRI